MIPCNSLPVGQYEQGNRAVRVVGSVFRLRRDLVPHLKRIVSRTTSLTLEEADMLLDLFGAKTLNWNDPKADADGYVMFRDLKRSLVHGALLTRRIASLQSAGLVEGKKASEVVNSRSEKVDRKSKSVRISKKGEEVAKALYDEYARFCEILIRDLPVEDGKNLLRINESLMNKLQWKE